GVWRLTATAGAPDETDAPATAKEAAPARNVLRCHVLVERIDSKNNTITAITLKGASANDVAALLPTYALGEGRLPALVNIPLAKRVKLTHAGTTIKLAARAEKQVVLRELAVSEAGLENATIQRIEDGNRVNPRATTVYRIRYALTREAANALAEAFGSARNLA